MKRTRRYRRKFHMAYAEPALVGMCVLAFVLIAGGIVGAIASYLVTP